MKNMQVVEMLEEIGDLKEIAGENPFKVRAYRRASEAIGRLAEDVEEIVRAGKLETIDGVGASLAAKIKQFLATGSVKELEELRSKLPPSLRQLLQVPEMGPKTVALVYEKLGITTIEQLERAAKEGRLRGLPGMGAKKEENILRGIEVLRSSAGRVRLDTAVSVAEPVVSALRQLPQVKNILPAGSLRRMKETIGDIDILVATRDSEPIMERFVRLPGVKDVLAHGATKSSVRFEMAGQMIQVDVRAVEPESFGAAAQYFTGSKEHNIALRERAIRMGLKVNEYGVFKENRDGTEEKVAGETEEGVYEAIGLQWIPPEMRENHGEIELAAEGKLPRLIELNDIQGDLHMHTNWSDGSLSVEDMARAAKRMGYKYCAITDHSPPLGWGVKPEEFVEELKEIRRVNEKLKGMEILTGMEVDILADGRLGMDEKILKQVDLVVASVHSGFKMERKEMTQRILKAMRNPLVKVLGHATGRLIGQRPAYEVDFEELVHCAREEGVLMEINASPERLDVNDEQARYCRESGVLLLIGTDAHAEQHLKFMRYGVSVARRAWLEPKDVVNTLPLKKLRQALKK